MFRKSLIDPASGSITLRCFSVRRNGYFVAICLDLCLAVQAESFEEARDKLHDQVIDYLLDAKDSLDFRSRPAPVDQWVQYYVIRAMYFLHSTRNRFSQLLDMRVTDEELRPAA